MMVELEDFDVRALVSHGRALLAQTVSAGWSAGLLAKPADGMFATALTTKQIEAIVGAAGDPESPVPVRARRPRPPVPRALRELLAQLGASELAPDWLSILLAAELCMRARALITFLREGVARAPDIELLVASLGDEAASELLRDLGPGSALRSFGLIDVVEKSDGVSTAAAVRLTPRFLRWFLRQDQPDSSIGGFTSMKPPRSSPELAAAALAAHAPILRELEDWLRQQRSLPRATLDLVLRGPRGAGRTELVFEACRRLGRPAIVAAVPSLAAQPHLDRAVSSLLGEAILLDAQVVLVEAELLAAATDEARRLRSALAASFQPLVMITSGSDYPRLWNGRKTVLWDVHIVGADTREAIWAELLPSANAGELASLYRIGTGAIGRIANTAILRASVRGEQPTHGDIVASVRGEFETDLGAVATKAESSQTWDDLVIADETRETIAELVYQLRHRSTVLGRWGFQRKLGKGLGTTALFSGEPGTGKSMVAGLIARELGLELYQIDLSRVVSKWLGETEKNLAKLFDAAESGHALLLFDEADALVGKRTTDVKSSNDRYANMETNYILQRLEAFHGIAILTSNIESAVDPALSRRLSFEVRFPFPDEEIRAQLWQRMLPDELPRSTDLDFALLARRFEIAGGHIRNIVLRAAYLAAEDNRSPLRLAHLLRAAEREYRDHGILQAKGKLKL